MDHWKSGDQDRRADVDRRADIQILNRDLENEIDRRRDWEGKQENLTEQLINRLESIATKVTSIWAVCMFLAAAIPIGLTIIGLLIK